MNKKFIKLLSLCLFCVICFVSCERYPVKALLGLADPIDSWPNPWYIYDDEINTKGSLAPYRWEDDPSCADWDKAKLDFACTDNPKRGRKCMQLLWVGNVDDSTGSYFGFGLRAREWAGGTIDIAKSGYTFLKFYVRGNLCENCILKVEVPGTDISVSTPDDFTVTPTWQEVSVRINNIESIEPIEYDIAIALIASGTTNGGMVYLDDIRFTKEEI